MSWVSALRDRRSCLRPLSFGETGRRWLASLGLCLLVACSSDSSADEAGPAGPGNGNHDGPSLAFRPDSALMMVPRETRELTVEVSPAARHTVRFALLAGSSGEGPADAALDRSEADTDDDGIASVVLTAPSAPVTFTVRASIDGGSETLLGVSVSASGFADLEIVPSYAGTRMITGWVATVRAGLTCDDPELAGTPPPDGDLRIEGDNASDLVVKDVPVGPVLAVTARAGHYIGGCATVTDVQEGGRNRAIVPVSDRPVQLAATRLALSFGFETVSPAWTAQLDAAAASVLGELRGSAGDDLSALLDALETVVPAEQQELLATARDSRGWDAALHAAYPGDAVNVVTTSAGEWMAEGVDALFLPDAIEAELAAEGDDPARAILTLLRIAGREATLVGFPATAPAAWSADSHDVVLVGSTFYWLPQVLLTGLATAPAQQAYPTADGVSEALAERLDCALFSQTLIGAGEPQGEIYPSCTELCSIEHCRAAVAAVWERAAAVATLMPLFSLSASGASEVGDAAEAVSLAGSWLGRFSADNEEATAGGPFAGLSPAD